MSISFNASRSAPRINPDEATARRLLLVQALETQDASGAPWTAEDRAWATRLARETAPAGASDTALLAERSRHVLQRLQPRDAALAAQAQATPPRLWWQGAALLLGLLAGLAVDAIGGSQHINLLAPPVWGLIAWNLLVYASLALPGRWPRALQRLIVRQMAPTAGSGPAALHGFHALWAQASAPLLAARAARLVHLAALGLGLGLVASLYLRGLVLDYRAGWQSTFLNVEQVQAALAGLLAPASALTGIAVPDAAALQALRIGPGGAPTASAAPWLHLYATMLGLFVLLPRALLVLWAGARAGALARHLPLPADSVYAQRLLHELRGSQARVQVWPHGAPAGADALAGLRQVLRAALGDTVQVAVAPATAYGDEDAAAAPAPAGTTLGLLLADLGATPEDDTHGRLVQALRLAAPGLPLLCLLDEATLVARFAALPARLAERRAAWQRFADAQKLPLLVLNLAQPDTAAHAAALQHALQAAARR